MQIDLLQNNNQQLYFSQKEQGFPRSIGSIEKVLNFKIGFQDLEKILNLAKVYIKYWRSVEILNGKEIRNTWAEFYWRQSDSLSMQWYAMCEIELHD